MRKWFYAGAVFGGALLLGAAPAQADVAPAPAGGLLSPISGEGLGLDPSGALNLESPLGDAAQLMSVKPGQNSADVEGPGSSLSDVLPRDNAVAPEADEPAVRAPAADSGPADLPLVGGLTGGGHSGGGLPLGGLSNLLPTGLLGGGLLGGGMPGSDAPRESALFDGGIPLLGGLGGLMPANEVPTTLPADGSDAATGMPAGGTAVDPDAADPALVDPAMDEPVEDPRIHEEPVDDEAGGKPQRSFSDGGRPVAGEDRDFR